MKITYEVREKEKQTDNLPTVSPLVQEKINHWSYFNEREPLESESCITIATSGERNTKACIYNSDYYFCLSFFKPLKSSEWNEKVASARECYCLEGFIGN